MDHTRHTGIYNVPTYYRVGIVGAGGIGATAALALAKMGVVQMSVWDNDVVSDVNIPTQLHAPSEIHTLKVVSLQKTLEHFSDEILFEGVAERIDESSSFGHFDLLVSAVDSIIARQNIWSAVIQSSVDFYIDARMAAEEFQMFVLNMHDFAAVEHYHAMLMSLREEDVPELTCTEKATFHCALAAAANIGAALRNILRNQQKSERVIHYIPQFTAQKFSL